MLRRLLAFLLLDDERWDSAWSCTASLVERDWALTSAACLRESGAAPATPGAAPLRAVRFDRYGVIGAVLHPTRNVALLHLDQGELPPNSLTAVALSATAPAAGETLRVAGAGRTATEWVPTAAHAGQFAVQSASADTVSLAGDESTSVCLGDAGGPVVRDVAGTPTLVAVVDSSTQAGCLDSKATEGHTATAARVDDLGLWIKSWTLGTSFEENDLAVVPNTVASGGVSGVVGVRCSLPGPELGVRTERPRTGTRSLMYSGSNSTCVAIDLDFTDGTHLRSLKAWTNKGAEAHPAKQCGHLTLNAWNQVQVRLGAVASGKRIKTVNVGYDPPVNKGGYRGFIDNVVLSHGCVPLPGGSCAQGGVGAAPVSPAPTKASDVDFDDPVPVIRESAVENFTYPGAAEILTAQKVKIISGTATCCWRTARSRPPAGSATSGCAPRTRRWARGVCCVSGCSRRCDSAHSAAPE